MKLLLFTLLRRPGMRGFSVCDACGAIVLDQAKHANFHWDTATLPMSYWTNERDSDQ